MFYLWRKHTVINIIFIDLPSSPPPLQTKQLFEWIALCSVFCRSRLKCAGQRTLFPPRKKVPAGTHSRRAWNETGHRVQWYWGFGIEQDWQWCKGHVHFCFSLSYRACFNGRIQLKWKKDGQFGSPHLIASLLITVEIQNNGLQNIGLLTFLAKNV